MACSGRRSTCTTCGCLRRSSPANQDGEAVDHRLVSLAEAARLAAQSDGPDVVTADASLVILDCLLRQGAIPRTASARDRLEALVRRDYG